MPEPAMNGNVSWWQRAVVYEIYVRSFLDTNGDGVGDLNGIRTKLGYLEWLGIDAIWLTPFYPSPMKDTGYDVADYCDVDPIFGNLKDFDDLVSDAHSRGIKLIVDFVPNHTSDRHPWFMEARASSDSPRRDWYIWRDPSPSGGPPNNWLDSVGNSAWELDPQTGQYYYHAFLKEQPDLNWRNEGVQQAMLDNMRFWFERDVDGFRVDVIWHLIKDQEFRDNPIRPDYDETGMLPNRRLTATFSTDRPEVHQIIASMRSLVNRYDSRVLIGEIYLPVERLMLYYGASEDEVHLPFNFQLLFVEWSAKAVAQLVNKYEESLPPNGWPNWVLGNHDNPRIATRIGEEQARLAAMLLLTLRGTPTIYYGDELGMLDVEIPASQVRDNFGIQTPGLGRDGCRTPMPWSAELNGGFTSGIPWLPLGTNAGQINVDALANNPLSILSLYRRLLAIRKTEPALYAGTYRFVCVDQDVLVFCRESGDRRLVVALNFGDRQVNSLLPVAGQLQIVASTELRRSGEIIGDSLNLSPYEGVLAAPVP